VVIETIKRQKWQLQHGANLFDFPMAGYSTIRVAIGLVTHHSFLQKTERNTRFSYLHGCRLSPQSDDLTKRIEKIGSSAVCQPPQMAGSP